jgi:hypothetical protein
VAQAADGRRTPPASGGRRILPAVTASVVRDGLGVDLDAAIWRRNRRRGAIVIGDVRPAETRQALRTRFDYEEARIQTLPMKFACPSVVLRGAGSNPARSGRSSVGRRSPEVDPRILTQAGWGCWHRCATFIGAAPQSR